MYKADGCSGCSKNNKIRSRELCTPVHTAGRRDRFFSMFSKDFSLRPALNAPSAVGVVKPFKDQQEAKIPIFPFPSWVWRARLWKWILMLNYLFWHNSGIKKISFTGPKNPLFAEYLWCVGNFFLSFCSPVSLWAHPAVEHRDVP